MKDMDKEGVKRPHTRGMVMSPKEKALTLLPNKASALESIDRWLAIPIVEIPSDWLFYSPEDGGFYNAECINKYWAEVKKELENLK